MARRQKARPQCLRPYPRGVRGETEGADRGDESGDRGPAEAKQLMDLGENDGWPPEEAALDDASIAG